MSTIDSKKSAFVTVGSTSFDDLIKSASSKGCVEFLKLRGFEEIVFQIGNGTYVPEETPLLKVRWFRFKDSLSEDIKKASLVIGHAGAGTILESLSECKPLIVVMNEKLMDNHQSELAERLSKEGYLIHCFPSQLLESIIESNTFNFKRATSLFHYDVFYENLEHILALK